MKCSSPNLSTFWISWVTLQQLNVWGVPFQNCYQMWSSLLLALVKSLSPEIGMKTKKIKKQKKGSDISIYIFVFPVIKSSGRNFSSNELGHIPNVTHWLVSVSLLGTLVHSGIWFSFCLYFFFKKQFFKCVIFRQTETQHGVAAER